MPQFTSSVEAQYAETLRANRDRTDAQIGREFFIRDPKELAQAVAEERAKDTETRRSWLKQAAETALAWACMDAHDAGHPALDGASVTITIEDLTATAVLTLPETN